MSVKDRIRACSSSWLRSRQKKLHENIKDCVIPYYVILQSRGISMKPQIDTLLQIFPIVILCHNSLSLLKIWRLSFPYSMVACKRCSEFGSRCQVWMKTRKKSKNYSRTICGTSIGFYFHVFIQDNCIWMLNICCIFSFSNVLIFQFWNSLAIS